MLFTYHWSIVVFCVCWCVNWKIICQVNSNGHDEGFSSLQKLKTIPHPQVQYVSMIIHKYLFIYFFRDVALHVPRHNCSMGYYIILSLLLLLLLWLINRRPRVTPADRRRRFIIIWPFYLRGGEGSEKEMVIYTHTV